MAFFDQELRAQNALMPVSGVVPGSWDLASLVGDAIELPVRRGVSMALSASAVALVLSAMLVRPYDDQFQLNSNRAIQTIEIAPPANEGVAVERDMPSGGLGNPPQEAPQAGSSVLDVSSATPLTVTEWSVSRITPRRMPATVSGPTAGTGTSGGIGAGSSFGGSGVYDPYAGATPLRREGPLGASAPIIPPLPGPIAAVTRSIADRRLATGSVRCEVLIALTGMVLEANCGGQGQGNDGPAISALLLGQRLYASAPGTRRTILELRL